MLDVEGKDRVEPRIVPPPTHTIRAHSTTTAYHPLLRNRSFRLIILLLLLPVSPTTRMQASSVLVVLCRVGGLGWTRNERKSICMFMYAFSLDLPPSPPGAVCLTTGSKPSRGNGLLRCCAVCRQGYPSQTVRGVDNLAASDGWMDACVCIIDCHPCIRIYLHLHLVHASLSIPIHTSPLHPPAPPPRMHKRYCSVVTCSDNPCFQVSTRRFWHYNKSKKLRKRPVFLVSITNPPLRSPPPPLTLAPPRHPPHCPTSSPLTHALHLHPGILLIS